MCGIVGIVAKQNVNQELYDALTVLQHRGQDSAGIVTSQNGRLNQRKDNGLVRDVFRRRHMELLEGNVGIGHVRYPSQAASTGAALAQPFYVNSPYGISLAHDGSLTNAEQLRAEVFRDDLRHVNTSSDSEVLLNVFAHELQASDKLKLCSDDIFAAVTRVHQRCRGAYAVVAMIANHGMVAFRDPHGIRPAVIGERQTAEGTEYMVASESVALDVLGFTLIRDIAPGEAIHISPEGEVSSKQCIDCQEMTPCIFEFVYFARPDSIIDGISVYKSRMRMGEYLAQKILAERPDHDIDVVIPIPDTSRVSAQALAYHLGLKFREGLMKNRYIGRTFIMQGQNLRKKSVRQKLNAIGLEFKGKNVLLVDDSIVRGTTCKQIIEMAREAGAKKVYFASAAPEVRHPNVYGIDMPRAEDLIAHNRTTKEIEQYLGADWLVYQDLDDLVKSCREGNERIKDFDCSVFTGNYITADIDEKYLHDLAESNDVEAGLSNESTVGLHNENA